MPLHRLAAIVGMKAEAKLIPGLVVGISGGDPAAAHTLAKDFLTRGCAGLISFGIAGGLSPRLQPGSLVIATAVVEDGKTYACHPGWVDRLRARLVTAYVGPVAATAGVVRTAAEKTTLHQETQALAIDLESGAVARAAQAMGRPFAVIRVVADPAQRTLPCSALVGLGKDGSPRPLAVIASLLRHPGDLPGLLQVAKDAKVAMETLRGAALTLGPTLSL